MLIDIANIVVTKRRRPARRAVEIAESIKQIGLLNPITVGKDFTLIAGLNRLEAHKILGLAQIECNVTELSGLQAQLAEIDENAVRDDLTVFESAQWLRDRKRVYLEMYPETARGIAGAIAKHATADSALAETPSFVQSTAALTGNSSRVISEKVQIATELETYADDIAELPLAEHKTDLLLLARIKRKDEAAAGKIVELLKADATGEIGVEAAYKEIRAEEKKAELQEKRVRLHDIGKDKSIAIDFRLGDFEVVFADVADGSVDCIITDPPYPFEFIECWSKLSRFAKRVLKPNGYCIAYSGQYNLPEVISRMCADLDYYWTFAVYHEGQTQIVNGVNLICRWKPVLIFQNGKRKLPNTFQDYFISEQREKESHDWQQSKSGVGYLIEMFTQTGDLICEPFAGSGTTIKAAIDKERRIIAAEIDEETYNIARANL